MIVVGLFLLFIGLSSIDIGQTEGASMLPNLPEQGATYLSSKETIQVGDIIVIEGYLKSQPPRMIKRVIGLPGDWMTFCGDNVFAINGEQVSYQALAENISSQKQASLQRYRTKIKDIIYDVGFERPPCETINSTSRVVEFVVPTGHYFVLGDNRDLSLDSRAYGMVPSSHVLGQVWLYW